MPARGRPRRRLRGRRLRAPRPEARAPALARAATRRSFGHNAFIYLQDDEARHLFFVLSGHVRLSYLLLDDGSTVLHGILPPGESFGELGVFENSTYCDMATAVGAPDDGEIPIQAFRALSERHPEIGDALARVVARRYRSYVTLTPRPQPQDPAGAARPGGAAPRRRARHLGRGQGAAGRPARAVVNQTDLGLMARGSRGNVNRALKAWERAGWIGMQDRCILILDRARLEGLAVEEVL